MINLDQLLNKKKPTVGIDISSASVKLLELTKQGKGYRVDAFGMMRLPENVIVNKEIQDEELLIETITACLKIAKTNATQAVISVPDSAVISKVITMDASLSEDEMEVQISVEADKYIPYPIEDVSLDFHVLGTSEKDPELVEVLLAAAKTTVVDARADVVSAAGLKPMVVDVESFAVERAGHAFASQLPGQGLNKLVGILDFGAHVSTFTVLENLRTVFSREEEFGGYQLVQALKEQYGKTQQEAHDILASGQWPEGFLENIVEPFKNAVVMQANRVIQFYASTSHHTDLDALMIAGGTALLPGLADAIQSGTNIPTNIANPFIEMNFRKGIQKEVLIQQGPTLLTCTGLALRAFDL